MKSEILILFLILASLSLVVSGCSKSQDVQLAQSDADISTIGIEKGDLAPDFEVQLIDGSNFKLSDYKGEKPVLVEFWATWCPFCRRDFSVVKNVYPKYKDDVVFLAIDLDASEDAETIQQYVNNNGLNDIKFALAKTSVLSDYGIRSTTTKYAIGKNGVILWKGSGAVDEATWEIILNGLKQS